MTNFIYGILISASLIIAIGAQNTYVIKQGILRQNIFAVSLTCFICDFVLMTLGVFFVGSLSEINIWFNIAICILSVIFLLLYSYDSFKSAIKKYKTADLPIDLTANHPKTATKAILSTLAITLFNPHVYLDAFFVLGGYASSLDYNNKILFLSGALISSFAWFFLLGYFSKYLSPFFQKPKSWFFFDLFVSLFMFVLAINIFYYFLNHVI